VSVAVCKIYISNCMRDWTGRLMEMTDCRSDLASKRTDGVWGPRGTYKQPAAHQMYVSILIDGLRGCLTTLFQLCFRIGCKIFMYAAFIRRT
jgi:hypothetical protein